MRAAFSRGKLRGSRGSGAFFAVALAAVALPLWLCVAFDTSRLVGRTFPGFFVWQNGIHAAFHVGTWTGPRAGLPTNGQILRVDGRPFESGAVLLAYARRLPEGQSIDYRIRHGSAESRFTVATMRLGWADYLSTFGVYLVNALVLFGVAIVAILLRPDRGAARAVAVAAVAMGLVLVLSLDFLVRYRFTNVYPLVEAGVPGALLYFARSFPVERRLSPLLRRLGMAGLVGLLGLGIAQVTLFHTAPALHERVNAGVYGLFAVALVVVLASLGHHLARSRVPEARLQAGIVFAGAVAAATPAVILIPPSLVLGWSFSFTWIVASGCLLPLSILYAVLVRDLLQAERMIRLTIGYAMTTAGVVLGYSSAVFAIDRLALAGARSHPATLFGLPIALALALDPARSRVQRVIDRFFFRTNVDTAAVLEQSGTEVATLQEEVAIRKHVERVLADSLALDWAEWSEWIGGQPERSDAALYEVVRFRGEPLGVLYCGGKRSGAPFSSAERELVSGIASQAALAMQNVRALRALREAQNELVERERFAAIGELGAAVAHGLRNPLAGIRAAAQVARQELGGGAADEPLADVISEVDRLDDRVRTLLEFARPYEPQLEDLELGELVRVAARVLEPRAQAAGASIEVSLPASPVPVYVDPGLVEEAVHELVGNALCAVEKGGRVTIELEADGSAATLRVRDTGRGIARAVQHQLFDLFFTTRPDGTGMGLAIVRKSLERLGGSLELESSGSHGTTFCMVLPIRSGRVTPA